MKKYIKPAISLYDVAPTSIMAGSVKIRKARVGISSFFTDDNDWETDDSGNKTNYNFWD